LTLAEKATQFKALHEGPGAFVLPNPWDAGSARILTALGFKALASSSAALAFSLGRRDGCGAVSLAETLQNARAIVDATNLPVSADLENGFGDRPKDVADTIRQAASIGLVGGSVEDSTGDAHRPIYEQSRAVERIAAAASAARSLPFPFVLTARAENFLHGSQDLDDTIRRLQAYAAVGADVLYAPGLLSLNAIREVCAAVAPHPVNVLAAGRNPAMTVANLEAAGVRRISTGSGLARVAAGALIRAAREAAERGTFTFSTEAVPLSELNQFMSGG
jgi:2-methylisocitrate lyase-like PEP mutase family enzyme